jgi:hypothetical protein
MNTEEWEKKRDLWVKTPGVHPNTRLPTLDKEIPIESYPTIYRLLCEDGKQLKYGIPLKIMIKILYSQWETEDWFPKS